LEKIPLFFHKNIKKGIYSRRKSAMKMKKWTILHGNFLPSLPGSGKFVKVSIPPGPFGGGQNV
jgi:hypothetical protein